jgi:hypothetical protein
MFGIGVSKGTAEGDNLRHEEFLLYGADSHESTASG